MKFQINLDINNTLLNARSLMQKQNFRKAYESLKLALAQGLYHSDAFYLFGEICRILKKADEAEKNLLESLKFEQHSPFVYNSLGLLYHQIYKFKSSNNFYKHFLECMETSDAYFHMAKNYIELKKFLKAAIYITKAISFNKNCREYYTLRARIYDVMGYRELADEDRELARYLGR